MPEESSAVGRLKRRSWRVLLFAVVAVSLVVLVSFPELAALGFLFDPVLLDVAIMFFGTQLVIFNGQIRSFFGATYSRIVHCFKTVRLKR